jgi:membrane-bound ClpP family serine protease
MDIALPPRYSGRDEVDTAKPIRRQGVGGLLLFLGAGLIASDASMDSTTIGGGLGLLLLLVGAGLVLHRQPEDHPAR